MTPSSHDTSSPRTVEPAQRTSGPAAVDSEPSSPAPSVARSRAERPVEVHAGHHEVVIRGRYETLSIANDILIGLIFLAGSFLFFGDDSTVYAGTWLFVVGSVLMLIRPSIRITRHVHLQRLAPGSSPEAARDF
ncbi:hypothetical protein KVA01_09330 [Kocuria varians]|uniref:YrhK domain-containing protein n=1 Tax=Kocuria varians TaxID=1272 RepID=A0A4Y4D0T0_KOCVA|nr:YrhK family protein [Kocuria varians]GEC98778.1 hypothetical protein KVA01_09330 [Kocuria varians]